MLTIANKQVTKDLLEKYNLQAKKRLGQNFIIDPSVVRTIAQKSLTTLESTVVEIGPGLGALTQFLAPLSKKVIAIEIDEDMVEVLTTELASLNNVEIIHEDFLKWDVSVLGNQEVIVVANVPYYITTPIIFKWIESAVQVSSMTLMMQKELAHRLVADINTKDYNALSLMIQYLFEVKTIMQIPKQCFLPIPKVDSSVIQFVSKNDPQVVNQSQFFEFLKQSFQMKRKTLVNNLKTTIDKDQLLKVLDALKISPDVRAEAISLDQFIEMYRRLYE
ncbi:MAG TPA: ribosomal RNA small subunit methyltransferase A [Erysipelothrix sp.]|nr:ribosomal RNA small subunit methyltransferase A [Erysipelothrix sp.]